MSDKKKNIPKGISVINFEDESKTIHADLPPDKAQAKRPSRRIYKDAMTDISTEKKDEDTQ